MWDWLLSPMDATRAHDVGWHLSWYARITVLSWGVLVPTGIVIARFFKIAPWQDWPHTLDSHFWWNTHRVCQYSAFVLMFVGLGLILNAPQLTIASGPHWIMGWTVLGLGVMQVAGGMMRGTKGGPTEPTPRGDHFDMTPRRLAFEYAHKTLGYVAALLAMATILVGLWQANAPNWMWVSICLWWAFLVTVFVLLQRRGMAIDTYQAIWGPDPSLPGNARSPIGFGITRRDQQPGE